MHFRITIVSSEKRAVLPVNYAYPLSSAIYRIIARGNEHYAAFLHETGYGKGFKFFSFSQLNVPFEIQGDRMKLLSDEANFQVAFHLPEAMESFIKGLFQSEQIEIADKKSRGVFRVKSVESLPDPLQEYRENEIVNVQLKPLSPVVAGLINERGYYDFLSPDDEQFAESLVYNWRSKIASCYEEQTARNALLLLEVIPGKHPPKSRLITIKADTPEETKIRGWVNFGLMVTAERRFVGLLLNAGTGVYNSMGCGCVEGGKVMGLE